jgi:hypothetical protein
VFVVEAQNKKAAEAKARQAIKVELEESGVSNSHAPLNVLDLEGVLSQAFDGVRFL